MPEGVLDVLDEAAKQWQTWVCLGSAMVGLGSMLARELAGRRRSVVVAGKIRTGADAARAAAKLGQELVERELLDRRDAAELAAHEFSHALADRRKSAKPGSMGYDKSSGDLDSAWYEMDLGDPENTRRVVTAPSRLGKSKIPMSDADVELLQDARKQIERRKKRR